nr:RNA-dependent RNA polymerase [Aspergillus ochraceopetaliformis chrysovirus 1]
MESGREKGAPSDYLVHTSSSKMNHLARKQGGEDLVNLTRYVLKHRSFLGTSKAGHEYNERILNSIARYKAKAAERSNLFAIIMPAGHGKTYLAERYGLIDVDMLITPEEHSYFISMRQGILSGVNTWTQHNEEWCSRMNKTLDLLDYSRPVVMFCHHEEIALELGAQVLGACKITNDDVFYNNIRHRDELSRHFSIMSRDAYQLSPLVANSRHVGSNEEVEAFFLDLMNANGLPVACPAKYSTRYANPHYHSTVPMWIKQGKRAGSDDVNISRLIKLFDQGMIPKECVDYYVRQGYAVTQLDFGVTMFEWVQELAKMPPTFRNRKEFNTRGDMVELFPPRGAKELSRANVTIRRMIETFDIFTHEDAEWIAQHHVGDPHIFVTCLLAHWKSEGQFTSVASLILPWYKVSFFHWTKLLKNMHSLIRTSRFFMNTQISERDRQIIMYMDLLVGREDYIINEEAEIEKRSGGTYHSNHLSFDPYQKRFTRGQYDKDFRQAINMAHVRFRSSPRKVKLDSFVSFYERRKTWLTKGSIVHNKLPSAIKKYSVQVFDATYHLAKEIQKVHNKQSLFECQELWTVMKDVTAEDFNVTKTAIKYETGGKERVLLPGSLGHFIIFAFVLAFAEKQEQVGSVRLNGVPDEDIRLYDRKMSTGVYHLLYDWADFNEQHSADEMAAVIQAIEDSVQGTDDLPLFTQAIIEGMYNMYLEDREGKRHKIWKGLYSGWRGTTWVNSVLNFCYLNIALENYRRMYHVDAIVYVDHGGDDVDLALSEATDMVRVLRIMDYMLFNANAWKQMLSRRSEFFRNTTTSQAVYASPTRALASFIAGDWEGAGTASIPERIQAILDQVGKLIRRGVDYEFCNGLVMCSVSHWAKIKDGDQWLSLPPEVKHARREDGGLGLPDKHNRLWVLRDKIPQFDEEWFNVVVPDMKASQDYIKVLSREVGKFNMVLTKREQLAKKYAEDAYDVEKNIDYLRWKELLSFRSEVVGYEDVIVPRRDNSLFDEFLGYSIDYDLVEKTKAAQQYLELKGHLSRDGVEMTEEQILHAVCGKEVTVDAIEFQGNIYYRRLVPDFMAYKITWYCRDAINRGIVDTDTAMFVFETLCYMAYMVFGHHA